MDLYQTWTQRELQWAEPLRKRKKKILRKVFLLILLPFAGGALIIPFAMQPYVSEPLEGLAYSVLMLLLALLLMLLVLPVTLPQTTRGHFARRLRKRLARQASGPAQLEDLAQDLLEALADPRRHFDYEDRTQTDAPYHFLLGRRYAFFSGGWTYTPFFLPLAGVRGFSSNQKQQAIGSTVIAHYYIWFEGPPKRDGFIFHDSQNRDRALAMLQAQLAGTL